MLSKKIDKRIIIKPIIYSTVIVTVLFIAGGTFLYNFNMTRFRAETRKQQEIEAAALKLIIQKYITSIKNDVAIFSELPFAKKYVENPTTNKPFLYSTAKRVGEEKKDYFQFRILNLSGHEIFRINYINQKGYLVSDSQLQDKSKRYYYKEALNLKKGQVMVSDYDYNIENEKIERPVKPTFRLTAPIYVNNKKYAYLIINFNSDVLGKEIKIFKNITRFDIYIVNDKKQFLCYKSCTNKKLEAVYKNPDKHKPLLDKIFAPNNFFNISNSYFHKIEIPLNTINNGGKFIYLAVELPANKYLMYREEIARKVLLYTLSLYFATLIAVYILLFLFFLFHKSSVQLKKASRILEISSEGVVITDKNGVIEYINPTFEKMFRCTSEDTLGFNITKFRSNFHSKSFYEAIWKRLDNTGTWEGDIVDILGDNTKQVKHLRIQKISGEKAEEILYLGVYNDITEIKKAHTTVNDLLSLDYLTGLPNKQTIQKTIDEKIEKFFTQNKKFSVISISIYNFKEINNIYGFDVGDKTLLFLIERLKGNINADDILGRIGDDHFLLVSNTCSFDPLNEYINNILKDCTSKPFTLSGKEIYLSIDTGIAIYPDNGITGEELIKASSFAIDNSSTEDKFSINYYSETLSLEAREKSRMLTLLEKAIERNEFDLKFQPKIDSRDDSIVGAEALIRWNNNKLGNVPPSIFIPLAEENGMINKISSWVVHKLCAHLKEWQAKGLTLKPVSFNLSPYDFARKDFPECLFTSLEECGVDNKNIEIEITEGVLAKDPKDVARKIDEIKSRGFKVLIDDFGTGYSSLEYLKKFNIDILKIDRAFIKDYPETSDGPIARAICELAHTLNIEVICEGVTTKAQVDFLSSIGCHIIQGFYYSPPVSSGIFEDMLLTRKIHKTE